MKRRVKILIYTFIIAPGNNDFKLFFYLFRIKRVQNSPYILVILHIMLVGKIAKIVFSLQKLKFMVY